MGDDRSNENKFNLGIAAVSGDISNNNEGAGDNKSLENNHKFKSGIENRNDITQNMSG